MTIAPTLGMVVVLTGLAGCQLSLPGRSPSAGAEQGENPRPASLETRLTRHYNQILALNAVTEPPKDLGDLRTGYRRLMVERAKCTDQTCLEALYRQLGEEVCGYYPFLGDSERCRQDFAVAPDEDLTASIGADLAAGKYNPAGWLKIDPDLTYDAAGEDLYAWLLLHQEAFARLVDRHGVPDFIKPLADPSIRVYALYGDARKIVELTLDPPREILWDLRFPASAIVSDPEARGVADFYHLIHQADEVFSFPSAIRDRICAGGGLFVLSSARQAQRSAATSLPLDPANPLAASSQPASATLGSKLDLAAATLEVAALVCNNGDESIKGFTLTCTSRDVQGKPLHREAHPEKRELLPGEMTLIEFPFAVPGATPPGAFDCQVSPGATGA